MTNRQRIKAILNYQEYDRLPIVHFGFWEETLINWANQGHISLDDAVNWKDRNPACKRISDKLGFDFAWSNVFPWYDMLYPAFETKIIKENPDGSKEVMDSEGVIVLQKDGIVSIPPTISHSLKDRQSWQKLYKPKLQFNRDHINSLKVNTGNEYLPFNAGGLEFLKDQNRKETTGLMIGSLIGKIRDWLGLKGLCYMIFHNEKLLDEMIETVADLCYKQSEYVLSTGVRFDFAHYWEDICFKNGPLIAPEWFNNKIGPHYKRINDMINGYGINIISVDCDGVIDSIIPTWLDNGVNTMFPIEVGTWGGSIAPWREKYGKELRGVGGMNKKVFAFDYMAIDAEIERLKPLVESGGFIPCPDHRIPPDAKWENAQYYCEKIREAFW